MAALQSSRMYTSRPVLIGRLFLGFVKWGLIIFHGFDKREVFGFLTMTLGFWEVWEIQILGIILFGLSLLFLTFLHWNVEKRKQFSIAFYVVAC